VIQRIVTVNRLIKWFMLTPCLALKHCQPRTWDQEIPSPQGHALFTEQFHNPLLFPNPLLAPRDATLPAAAAAATPPSLVTLPGGHIFPTRGTRDVAAPAAPPPLPDGNSLGTSPSSRRRPQHHFLPRRDSKFTDDDVMLVCWSLHVVASRRLFGRCWLEASTPVATGHQGRLHGLPPKSKRSWMDFNPSAMCNTSFTFYGRFCRFSWWFLNWIISR
jgi:hypothetical protein